MFLEKFDDYEYSEYKLKGRDNEQLRKYINR